MPTEAERLMAVETELKGVKEIMLRMDSKLDTWQATYVPRQEIDEMFKSRDKQIEDLKDELQTMRVERQTSRMSLPQWLMVGTSAASVAVALIVAFRK